jgi:hypothetical protein
MRLHRCIFLAAGIQFALLAQVAGAQKVEIKLDRSGRMTSAPAEANAGDAITVSSDGNLVKLLSLPAIPAMSDLYTGLKCPDKADENSIRTNKSDQIVVYEVCNEKTPKRLGVIILGPHRKVIYLAYSSYSDLSNPIHLQPLGGPPVLTTQDEPFLVIVNKMTTEAPADFDMTYTVKQGSFIDVAPVRPATSQPNAKFATSNDYFADYVLRFQKKFPGEQVVDYDVSGYFSAQTENKSFTKTDTEGKKTTETEIDTEQASHKIFSGELPQIHSLYYFNISTGVVASLLRDPSYARVLTQVKTDDNHPALYKTEQQSGSDRALPVLMFSAYLKPLDAQVPWRATDLLPAPTLGFSLSSPSADFFFGISSEVRRHVQLVAGYHLGKITTLPPTQGIDDPASSAAPVTATRFRANFFVGATFNVDFIKGLFK